VGDKMSLKSVIRLRKFDIGANAMLVDFTRT
jgi:hypothetical protein